MSLEAMQLYKEIKKYLIVSKYKYELKKEAPDKIKEKFKKFQEIATCEEVTEKKNKEKTDHKPQSVKN